MGISLRVFIAGMLACTLLPTQHANAEGNLIAGYRKSELCNNCHENNQDSSIPHLAGQHKEYLIKQMLAYRNGSRKDPIMTAVAMRLKGSQDIEDLATYFASLPKPTKVTTVSQNPLGEDVFQDKLRCHQCHGANGQGNPELSPVVPKIAGQNKDYIIKRLMEFQEQHEGDPKKNPMPRVAKKLNIVDIFSVAEYVSDM